MRPRILGLLIALALPLSTLGNAGELTAAQPSPTWPPSGWTVDSLTPALRWQSDGYTQVIVMPQGSSIPIIEEVVPKGQDTLTITTPLQGATTYRWRLRANPYPPSQNVYTWSAWTAEWTFSTPGAASWTDGALVKLVAPQHGTISSVITPTLSWTPPAGATYFQMVITPASSAGASAKLTNRITSSFAIPGPPSWYGMLPDTQYNWRVRVTNALDPVPDDHSSWGPWSDTWSFRTPIPPSEIMSAVTPAPGALTESVTPTLVWKNDNAQVFYYEVQLSKDPNFVTDPMRATAPVYWELRHGGLTSPANSYSVSSKYALDKGTVYYWRVRPAVPQAAAPVPWSQSWSFQVL